MDAHLAGMTKPCLTYHELVKNWGKLTSDMSKEELADFSEAR